MLYFALVIVAIILLASLYWLATHKERQMRRSALLAKRIAQTEELKKIFREEFKGKSGHDVFSAVRWVYANTDGFDQEWTMELLNCFPDEIGYLLETTRYKFSLSFVEETLKKAICAGNYDLAKKCTGRLNRCLSAEELRQINLARETKNELSPQE